MCAVVIAVALHLTFYYSRFSGRTGRAGRKGEAVTFFTERYATSMLQVIIVYCILLISLFLYPRDIPNMRSISNVMRLSGCDVPDWLLSQRKLCSRCCPVYSLCNYLLLSSPLIHSTPPIRDSKRMKLSAPLRKPIEGPRPVQKHYSRIQKKTSTPNPSSGGGNPLPYSSNE